MQIQGLICKIYIFLVQVGHVVNYKDGYSYKKEYLRKAKYGLNKWWSICKIKKINFILHL